MKNAFLLCLTVISLSACGPLKDMGDMKDTTNHMDSTTTHLDKTTSDMAQKTSDQMLEMITSMKDMKGDMQDMKGITKEKMSEMITEMKSMRGTTEHMSARMDGMYDLTKILSGEMEGVLNLTHEMLGKMEGLYDMTKDVLDTSKHMSTTTDNMLDITHNLYTDNRQNGSLMTRYYMLSALNDEKMTPGLAVKASFAAKYFMAFEFQVWKNEDTDTDAKREALEGNAIQEFFLEMRPYMNNFTDYSPLSVLNSTKNLMMISMAMSQPNPNQLDAAKQYHFEVLTLDKILLNGLTQKANVNSGKLNPVPAQVDQVLQNEDAAYYLLNVRHNVETMVALTKITGIDADYIQSSSPLNLVQKIINIAKDNTVLDIGKKLMGLLVSPIDMSGQNIKEMDIEIAYLRDALLLRQSIYNLRGSVEISDKDVAPALRLLKVTLDVSKLPNATKEELQGKAARVQTINNLIGLMNHFVEIPKKN